MRFFFGLAVGLFVCACGGPAFTVESSSGASPLDAVSLGSDSLEGGALLEAAAFVPEASAPTPEASASMPEASTPVPEASAPVVVAEASAPDVGSPNVVDDASGYVPLCVIGEDPGPFAFDPASLDFGLVAMGKSATKTVRFMDEGSCVSSPKFEGFGVTGVFTDATSCAGALLGPGGSCVFDVTFMPDTIGRVTSVVSGTVDGKTYSFSLAGVGE
jgi:hypothetical protein